MALCAEAGVNRWNVTDAAGVVIGGVSRSLFRYRWWADQNGLSPARGENTSLDDAVASVVEAWSEAQS